MKKLELSYIEHAHGRVFIQTKTIHPNFYKSFNVSPELWDMWISDLRHEADKEITAYEEQHGLDREAR